MSTYPSSGPSWSPQPPAWSGDPGWGMPTPPPVAPRRRMIRRARVVGPAGLLLGLLLGVGVGGGSGAEAQKPPHALLEAPATVTTTQTSTTTMTTTAPAQTVTAAAPPAVTVTETVAPAAAVVAPPAPAPVSTAAAPAAASVYYRNCDAARAAGAAPVRRGDPGYASHLDGDGDGVGCE